MYPGWERAEHLDSEIQSLMERSDLSVYIDRIHNCIHVMLGDAYEFTSAPFPLNDEIRSELRQQAYLLHNGIDEEERRRIKEANERRDQANENLRQDAKADWRDFATWECEHRFFGRDVTPMVIMPGGSDK